MIAYYIPITIKYTVPLLYFHSYKLLNNLSYWASFTSELFYDPIECSNGIMKPLWWSKWLVTERIKQDHDQHVKKIIV